ncbi:ZIP family metal transporter [Chitinilyticum piscinae]|uniref:ZIP family metal transporter n=1 Tax=Chitinilyticum piscinae TaxID=2866724 RepID=A0A8J7FNZ9_9NEIS|nr:ZIP family metal transporter [Chitinilyticum piscinae]MBE9610351.1 ZIP family metal transporter [Chitinilyticum piscinae]
MSTLSWIIFATLAGSLLSVTAAALLAYTARPSWIPKLVSFAVGALLAAAFLEILPHAFGEHEHGETSSAVTVASQSAASAPASTVDQPHDEHDHEGHTHHDEEHAHQPSSASAEIAPTEAAAGDEHPHERPSAASISLTLLAGILAFFILEKLVIWRHCHHEQCEELEPHEHSHSHDGHSHGHGRAGMMIIIGDTFHNFLDGALIAAAFMADTSVGIATAAAIIAHEIPQEVGDFIVLLHSGYSKARALLFNLLSSLAALAGALLAYWSLGLVEQLQPYLLALGASSMIYVAIADLIPGLHKRPHLRDTAQQVTLILAGVALIALPHFLLPH